MEQQKNNTALLVLDMQNTILQNVPTANAVKEKVATAIAFARERNMLVIYSVVGFRNGVPEISDNNKMFGASKARFASVSPEEWMKITPDVSPVENDIIVIKKRFSAFTGSDLEVVLRAQNIRHIILSGVSTSGVILSTTREAADKDYGITVLTDACGDADEEVHRVLMTKIFPRQAAVLTVDEWTS